MAFRVKGTDFSKKSLKSQVDAYAGRDHGLELVSGTKYSHLGGRRTGLASTMDTDVVYKNLEQRAANYGDGGYTFTMLNPDGMVKKDSTINIGGRVFRCRADGTFHITDSSMIKLIEQEQRERDEYIRDILKKCAIGDAVAAHILGLGKDFFLRMCAAGGVYAVGKEKLYEAVFQMDYVAGDPGDLDKFNCRPSFLHALDQNSTTFSGALSKLKAIVIAFLPILEDTSPGAGVEEHSGKPDLEQTSKDTVKEQRKKGAGRVNAITGSMLGDKITSDAKFVA